ncbi:replication protein O [Acinetobacter phage Ab65]|nr:replication protein O [Acinetobacter phage Ab65]
MSKWIPNSFQLPNALVDDKYLVEMKGSALAMYIFIVRKTRGWQKECDRISLSQFSEFTGYNKDAVLTGANKLVELGLVKRISFENKTSFYELNDQPLPPENLLSENPLAENQTSAVGKSAKLLSENQTHNNKENNLNKTNIEKPKKFVFKKALLDLGVSEKLVDDWLIVRKNKKASNTETAFNGFVNQVQGSGLDAETVLKICVDNSWSGFKRSWLANINMSDYLEQPKQVTEQKTNDFEWADF